MKIGIDIRSTLKKTTGVGRYTLNLINALAEVDKVNSYCLYSRKKILDFKRKLPKLPSRNFSHYVDCFNKGYSKVLPDIDTFFTPSYDLQKPKKTKFIVTIHGVIKACQIGHEKHTIEKVDEQIKRILFEADNIVADSYNTKSDLMKFYEAPDSKISVIYPIVNTLFKNKALIQQVSRNTTLRSDNFILFVGTLEPRKNIEGLIKAFSQLKKEYGIKYKLYIVGMKGWMFENIFKAYEESEFKKDIIFRGYVKESELKKLYKKASVFVYPSFYEGFGFPIIEAFSAGVPVVTSKTSSCGEIAGNSALLIDPSNYKEIGEAILKIINEEDLRKNLIEKGLDRAKKFTQTNTAKEFVKLFTQR